MEYDTTSIGEVIKPWLERSTHQKSAATAVDELFLPYPERDLEQTSARKLVQTIKKEAYIMEQEKAYIVELEKLVSDLEVENSKLKEEKEKQCITAYASSKKETQRGVGKIGAQLNLEDLKPHFGKRLKDVAEELDVGRSTIKRACRNYCINRWPCNKKHKRNPALFGTHPPNDSQQNMHPLTSSKLPLSDTFVHQNVPQTNTRGQAEAKNVTIKVKFEDDTIKLEFCPLSGMEKLLNEVAIRLSLKVGGFKLKYLDEDDDNILLACDADLQLCLKSLEKTCIKLFVHLIHN